MKAKHAAAIRRGVEAAKLDIALHIPVNLYLLDGELEKRAYQEVVSNNIRKSIRRVNFVIKSMGLSR